jgi:hypothetical protein
MRKADLCTMPESDCGYKDRIHRLAWANPHPAPASTAQYRGALVRYQALIEECDAPIEHSLARLNRAEALAEERCLRPAIRHASNAINFDVRA